MKVAFIGHRKIEMTTSLKEKLKRIIESLIVDEKADTFLFGSKSKFDELCHETVTELQRNYKYIQRIFVRAEYEYITESYERYLLTLYEKTFYPEQVCGAGAISYIKRNQVMIDTCDILVVYCDKNYKPQNRNNSGTKIAVEYAHKIKKRVINLFE